MAGASPWAVRPGWPRESHRQVCTAATAAAAATATAAAAAAATATATAATAGWLG